ncbi:MAG: hypothetical protein GXO84_01055 [Chlorobi bacterium]|nr:hypothetical protein [Chlorobiota bacterium]
MFIRGIKFVLALALFAIIGWIQIKPAKVIIKVFKTKYPRAKFAVWQQLDNYTWKVSFVLRRQDYIALFDVNGNWLETKTYVAFVSLATNTKELFQTKYKLEELQKVLFIKKIDKTVYKFQMDSGKNPYKLLFDTSNNVIKNIAS